MRIQLNVLIVVCLGLALVSGAASDKFPSLKVGDEVYSNVTVTSVTATDIYFSHSKGVGNAKLKSLTPELQKQFKFDPVKGNEVEQKQAVSTALFQMTIAAQAKEDKLRPKPDEEVPPVELSDEGDPVAPKLYA